MYHVLSRGNQRQEIYLDDYDRKRFLRVLGDVMERRNLLCHAYCLMGNHYHLLLETPDANLSLAVRQLNGVYAQWFNRRHDRVGHLFQGRFTSKLVQKELYLLTLSRYIVLNPVRAGLVACPAEWIWSSYRAQAGLCVTPDFLTVEWLLTCFDTRDRKRAERGYREFVHADSTETGSAIDDGPVLGDSTFVEGLRDRFREVASRKELPRAQRFAARPALRELLSDCRDKQDRNRRIRTAHVDHGYTMTEIARHLGLHLMTISRAVRKC